MQLSRYTLLAALVVSALVFALNQWSTRPPSVKPASAPASEFSAERAFGVLRELLAEGVPHPVASDANRRVRQRIERYLAQHGIEHEVQATWGCAADFNRCAFVENVVATIPGRERGPYLALMAHYDSVPQAPGAGDDGAGLVTVLETGRTLAAEGPRRNPLLLVLTDAEEPGLLGAEAFFREHPLAPHVGAVVNIEGAGTAGTSRVLRTAGASGSLVGIYRQAVAFPNANSFADEVFKRMPNDTDFSVSTRAGVPGIDLSFAGEFTHYHTPNDNLENLDQRSLQHHGENLLPLARALLDSDLGALKAREPSVYLQVLGVWLGWPAWMNWLLIAAAAVLLVVVARRCHYPGQPGWKPHVLGFLSPLLVIAGALAVGLGALELLEWWRGTIVSWPAVLWPWRLVLFGAPMLGGLVVAALINRYLAFAPSLIFALGAWLLLGVLLAAVMPGAAGLLIAPLLFAVILIAAATLVSHQALRTALLALAAGVAVTQTLGIVLPLEETQGYRLAIAVFPFIALFMVLLSPLVRGIGAVTAIVVVAVITGVGVVGAGVTPLYSAWRPQHVNVEYFEDVDAGAAWWSLESDNPLPVGLLRTKDFGLQDVSIYPWAPGHTIAVAARAPVSGWRGPGIRTLSDTVTGDARALELELSPTRPTDYLMLVLPESAKPRRFQVEGIDLEPVLLEWSPYRGCYALQMMGMRDRPVHVTLELANTEPLDAWVADVSPELPAGGSAILEARPPLATPVHTADNSTVYRKVRL